MRQNWKSLIGAFAVAAALAPSQASAAACGDLNNDGNRTIVDVLLMANCVAGLCNEPAQCGGAGIADCADTFGDGTTVNASDLNQLVFDVAGLETLHDLCADIGTAIACPGGQAVISGDITASQVWPSGCDIELDDTVFVETPNGGPTTVLTIQAGATIEGRKVVTGGNGAAALVFLPGAKISAIGSVNNPIVLTSDQAAGTRSKGDWGGVMFNGESTVNRPNCLGSAEGVPTPFGGCDVNDSSGVARYVRVEFAGLPISANNELNIWTMNGLGKGTNFSYIHANVGVDDCIEWFGGTNDMHHLVASGCADDGFDWQLGFTGTVQYGIYLGNGPLFDNGNTDSRGIEADNSEFGNNDLPRSNPSMCNLTLVGDYDTDSDSGILFRRGTAGQVANVIVTRFQDAGAELRDNATGVVACNDATTLSGNLLIQSGVFYNNGTDPDGAGPGLATEHAKTANASDPTLCSSVQWFNALNTAGLVTPNLSNPVNPGFSDVYPVAPALFEGRPTFTGTPPAATDCTGLSDAFESADYIGAIDPADAQADGWLSAPWNSFATN